MRMVALTSAAISGGRRWLAFGSKINLIGAGGRWRVFGGKYSLQI
jgi:hypothetical protein